MASAERKKEGAELFKRGITRQKLAAAPEAQFAAGDEGAGIEALSLLRQAATLLGLALDTGAYEGPVRGTLEIKLEDITKKADGLRAQLPAAAAGQADERAAKDVDAWQRTRAAAPAAAAPSRDAFKLAIGTLKKAQALHPAGDVLGGPEPQRAETLRLYTEGAALLAEACASPKTSEKVRAAISKKLDDVNGKITTLGGVPTDADAALPPAPTAIPRKKAGSTSSAGSAASSAGSAASSGKRRPPAIPPNTVRPQPLFCRRVARALTCSCAPHLGAANPTSPSWCAIFASLLARVPAAVDMVRCLSTAGQVAAHLSGLVTRL